MKLNAVVLFVFIVSGLWLGKSLQSQPKESPIAGIEYAFLYQQKVKVQAKDHLRLPYLAWRHGDVMHNVRGEPDYQKLLKEMGKEHERASFLDLLNYLGSQRWELCAASTDSESEPGLTEFIFKRQAK